MVLTDAIPSSCRNKKKEIRKNKKNMVKETEVNVKMCVRPSNHAEGLECLVPFFHSHLSSDMPAYMKLKKKQ